jgi:AcrR family transcriptional regulator
MTAIVEAARDLFAERGYAGVSVREIAERAHVNHGLVHRHFGAKDEVLRAVLQGMFQDVGALARSAISPADADFITRLYPLVVARKRDWQVLMRAVLDGFDFQAAGYRFPITAAVAEHVGAMRKRPGREARLRAGAIIAGGLGWLLLETYLSPILDLDKLDRDLVRARMAELYSALSLAKV